MRYPIRCECGKVYQFTAAQAGSRFGCPCGRKLVVPALSALRASEPPVRASSAHGEGRGQSPMSAEIRFERMLASGALPREKDCLICRRPTTAVAYCWARCELSGASREDGILHLFTRMFTFYAIGLVLDFALHESGKLQDRDHSYRLPLRVCGPCTDQLRDLRLLKETLFDVRDYSELLDKYPNVEVSLDAGLASIMRWER
jgi:hypothetical protein